MADITLKEKTRQPDRYLTLTRNADGDVMEVSNLTKAQYDSLALKGAGAPPGINKEDWASGKSWAAGGVRDYGGGQHTLSLGEFAELIDRYELGAKTKDGITVTVTVRKNDAVISKAGGLSITPANWPDAIDIVSIDKGIMKMSDLSIQG